MIRQYAGGVRMLMGVLEELAKGLEAEDTDESVVKYLKVVNTSEVVYALLADGLRAELEQKSEFKEYINE